MLALSYLSQRLNRRRQTRRHGISGVLDEPGAAIPPPQSGYPRVEGERPVELVHMQLGEQRR